MTVAAALAAYGDGHAPHKISGWLIGMAIEQLVKWWGDRPLSAITNATCQAYTRDRKNGIHAAKLLAARARAATAGRDPAAVNVSPITDSTPRRELAVLGAAVNWCVAEGRLVRPVPVWRPDKPEARDRWLTRGEVARLLWATRKLDRSGGYLALFVRMAVYTGQRKEAILGLQWQPNLAGGHVDLERGQIDFRKPGNQSDKRRSAIPIPPRLRIALTAARTRTSQYVIEYRRPNATERAAGIQAIPVGDVKKALARAADLAGVPGVTAHVFRHTAVTWLVQGGVPLWEVAQFVRLTPEMIKTVYGHHAPDAFTNVLRVQSGRGRA
ncbi:MAG: site-specific integrase [Alphaproteobacteria bacterium]|nr:site-specific integrase [Alphaproteobacteria bacterium]